MERKIEKRLEKLEKRRGEMFAAVEGIEDALLRKQPEAGKWSLVQVFEHLILGEEKTLSYLNKRLESPETLQNAGLRGNLNYRTLSLAFSLPLKFKAPAMVAKVPNEAGMSELKKNWDQVREGLVLTLEKVTPELFNKALFNHPRVGNMSIFGCLDFMTIHIEHHQKQVARIKQQIGI